MVEAQSFKEQWEAKKVLKRAKKKAKKSLQQQGYGRKEASKTVNSAIKRISTQTSGTQPERRGANRGG